MNVTLTVPSGYVGASVYGTDGNSYAVVGTGVTMPSSAIPRELFAAGFSFGKGSTGGTGLTGGTGGTGGIGGTGATGGTGTTGATGATGATGSTGETGAGA
ncbi:MAG: hypothetical protein ACREDH_13525 [Methylocella sp.]